MTELEVYRQPSEVAVRTVSDTDSWTTVLAEVASLAAKIADTPFVPDGLRGSVPAVAAAILTGRELGLPPLTSLANIHVIKGKPALSAALMRALILAQGHQIETVDISDTRAQVRGRRKGEATWEEASFTADQAKRAGIVLGGYPQDKLYARATSRLARRKFADVIAGMPYSAEDLEDGDVEGTVAETVPAIEQPKPRTAQRKSRATNASPAQAARPVAAEPHTPPPAGAGEALPPLPGEEETPDDPPGSERHKKRVGSVQGQFKRLGFTDDDREERLIVAAELAEVAEITSLNDLTPDELSTVADTLAKCRNRDALTALLVAKDKAKGGGDDAA